MNLTPEQYFISLANNDVIKYNELLNFSKQFISGFLSSPCTLINGTGGNNGKTVFIWLLKLLSEYNNVKSCFFVEPMLENATGIQFISSNNYAIARNSLNNELTNELVTLIHNLSYRTETKFIYYDRKASNDLVPGIISIIQLNAKFTRHNQNHFYFSQWSDDKKKEYIDFIMK
jgi:hypothetical protein